MKQKIKLNLKASLRKCLLVLCFCVSINLLGCTQTQPGGGIISAETPLAVIATEPATPAVLGLGEKLVVVIHFEPPTSKPVQIWTRPYRNGEPLQGYRAHRLETVSKENNSKGIVTGWCYYQSPTIIDEVRLFMRDSYSKEMIATNSYMIDARWASDPADDAKPVEKAVQANPKNKKRPPDTTVYDVSVANSPILGPKDAPVTIVEFFDFQCPYCVREFPKLQKILDEYPDQVRLVFKHYPLSFHKKAPAVHAATELALRQRGVDAFWMMHQMIMDAPKELDIAQLREYAVGLELNMLAFDKTMASGATINELLKADKAEAGKCNVSGTPTILINGLKMTDRSIEGYKARIDGILAETAK
jgi:protein-disulfide isomerase